jgi:hypothetical protein
MVFVVCFVLMYVSPKSPPWNASKSIRIFENEWLCYSGSKVGLGVQVGGEEVMEYA